MPPPRIATFFGDVLEDMEMVPLLMLAERRLVTFFDDLLDEIDVTAFLLLPMEERTVEKDEAGKRRDDRRVSLV